MVPGTSVRSGNDSLLNALISVIQALIFIFRSVELRCPCTPPLFFSMHSCAIYDPCELQIISIGQLSPNLS